MMLLTPGLKTPLTTAVKHLELRFYCGLMAVLKLSS